MTKQETIARLKFEELLASESGDRDGLRVARLILRHSKTYARVQEEMCSGPNDRFFSVATPAQIERWQSRLERRETQLEDLIRRTVQQLGEGFGVVFNGDPRGATVKITVPSGRTDDWGREGICVPSA